MDELMERVSMQLPQSPNRRSVLSRRLRLATDSRLDSLRDARHGVREAILAAGLSPDAATDMEIAASEILSNTHRHAYPGSVGPVFVEVVGTRTAVMVIIIDHGQATHALHVPTVQPSRTQYGGRGLYLVGQLTDHHRIAVSTTGHGLAVLLLRWVDEGFRLWRATRDVNQGRPVGTAMVLSVRGIQMLRRSGGLVAESDQMVTTARRAVAGATIERLEHRLVARPLDNVRVPGRQLANNLRESGETNG